MTQRLSITKNWAEIASSEFVTFQLNNVSSMGVKLLVTTRSVAPDPEDSIGYLYSVGEGELAKTRRAFGSGSTIYARTTHGEATLTVDHWN